MGEFLLWLRVHSLEMQIAAAMLITIGLLARTLSRARSKVEIQTHNRSVSVGRDNRGIINTGDVSRTANEGSGWLSNIASYASILGLAAGLLSLIPLIQGWLDGPTK
jgi:hypothetical protein